MYRSGLSVWYNVSNLEQTLEFYSGKLGFEVIFQDPANGLAMVNTNTKDCVIGFSEAQTVEPATSSTVFEVINIEEAMKQLEANGVTFIGEVEHVPGMAKLATFVDPDGHNLMLAETLVEL
jgi:predicted enzyme related to lactoylglutathione lyase